MNEHFNSTAMTSNDKKEYLVLITFSLWNLSLQGVAIVVFVRCKKISRQTRFWILCVLGLNEVQDMNKLVYLLAKTIVRTYALPFPAWLCYSNKYILRACVFVYIFSACALSFDRFISLKYAFHYQRFTRPRALRLYFVCMILISLASSSAVFVGDTEREDYCIIQNVSRATVITSVIMTFAGLVFITVMSSAFACITCEKLRENSNRVRKNYKNILITTIIVVHLNVTLLISSILNIFIFEKSFEENETLHQVSRIIISIFYITTPILFTCSFYESRYHFIRIVCCCSRKILTLKEMEHKNHYATYEIATVGRGLNTFELGTVVNGL